jgi:hypothetical protein
MSKSLEQLQYENAKLENDVNKGCGYIALIFVGIVILSAIWFTIAT